MEKTSNRSASINIQDELHSVCAHLSETVLQSSVHILNAVTDANLIANGERSHIRKIFSLILSSCVENSVPNEQVQITSTLTPTSIDIAFRLVPIPLFILMTKRLFEPIDQQLNTATIKSSPDSYIGLLLARKLSIHQRVKIWMQLENNTICTIHCQFLVSPPGTKQNREKPLILVIEDNKHIRKLMELYLHQAGFDTIGAYDGDSGLELALTELPDLITLDVMMPSKDGWQVLRGLKENPQTNTIPVIVVSVMKDTQIGYELGASDYLTKPVEHDELIESAKRLTSITESNKIIRAHKIHTVGVIDPSLQGIDMVLSKLGSLEVTIFESDVVSVFDALQNLTPDALIIVLPEELQSIIPLLYRLRLHKKLEAIPFIALTLVDIQESSRIVLDGIIDRIITSDELTQSTFESFQY